ncbi:MAG: LytTR family DNA-binding domain-containing protein [Burkholderiaceae bacterium]
MTTVLIADDEPLLRDQLRARLATAWPEIDHVDEAANGIEALAAFDDDNAAPDVCFLDIHMPGLSGIEVARGLRERAQQRGERAPHLVFVTAFDAYAIEAFEHGAIDYLLKPFETDRLVETIQRVKDRLAHPASDVHTSGSDVLTLLADRLAQLGAASRPSLQWIKASIGSTVKLIPVDEVLYFQADDKYTRVITADGEALIRKPIKELACELDGSRFWQIHRATIVNTRTIAGVVRGLKDSADLKLKNRPETLTVSRAYLHLFRQM